jgi:hypothetical protein
MVVSVQFFIQHVTMLPKTISTSLSTIHRESFNPTTSPTGPPTGPPSGLILYDAPTPEDCEKIGAGVAIEGEDQLLERSFNLLIENQLTVQTDIQGLLLDFSRKVPASPGTRSCWLLDAK